MSPTEKVKASRAGREPAKESEMKKKRRLLICNCCGNSAGRWYQWWNRDTGFGICARCAAEQAKDIQELTRNCGIAGVHFDGALIAKAESQ